MAYTWYSMCIYIIFVCITCTHITIHSEVLELLCIHIRTYCVIYTYIYIHAWGIYMRWQLYIYHFCMSFLYTSHVCISHSYMSIWRSWQLHIRLVAVRCSQLQWIAMNCSELQCVSCSVLQCVAMCCSVLSTWRSWQLPIRSHCTTLQHTAPFYNTLQHYYSTAHYTTLPPHCTTLHHTTPHCTTHCTRLHHIAPDCTRLHQTATHYNTPVNVPEGVGSMRAARTH